MPSVSGRRGGEAMEAVEPLLAFVGLAVHKQFEGTSARTAARPRTVTSSTAQVALYV